MINQRTQKLWVDRGIKIASAWQRLPTRQPQVHELWTKLARIIDTGYPQNTSTRTEPQPPLKPARFSGKE